MRSLLKPLLLSCVVCGIAAVGLAQEAKSAKKADSPTPAQLRAQLHRATAALIEAQAAEKPDPAKIQALTKKLQTVRGQLWATGPGPAAGRGAGWQCPWGGPGRGPGWGQAPGRGRGPGWGQAPGRGPGPGWGQAPGRGRGPGWGQGAGRGYGRGGGWGQGPGRGAGYGGRGMGYQWRFVDENRDGICDNYQRLQPPK